MERLHAGWLVKSPPEKRTFGPWRLFKSKWRERYFVLYAPPSSQTIPGCCSTVLCYYDNENLVKEYGRIDLSHCEEILTQLESDEHHNIFALRTVNKDSERTYYLAAGSEEEMNQWAHCLCCVLRLSGGDGNNLQPSGFENLSSPYGENILSPGRCPILTQRTGEQRRIANVPETISKSASALNIRLADATPTPQQQQPQQPGSNSTASVPKSGKGRMGKRPSILNMVVKPASSNTLRRPSAPVFALSSVAQKFQTVGKTTGLQLMTAANQSFLNNNSAASGAQHPLSSSSSTLGRPVHRLTLLPPTPAVSSFTAPFTGRDFFAPAGEHDAGRWRFGDAAMAVAATPSVGGQQCPPLLPSRPGAQSKDTAAAQVNRHRRSSSDDWRWGKGEAGSRNNDLIDEDSDEGSFEPDYVLPHPVYNNDDAATNGNNEDREEEEEEEEETEALEEDREDHYSYPPFHYNLSSPAEDEPPPRRTSPSPLTGEEDEGEPCDDSYDYLPCYSNSRAPSDRMSITRSSTHTNNSDRRSSSNEEAIYDVLPVRNYGSEETAAATAATATAGSVQRMSGVELSTPAAADQGIIYQNDAFRRYSYGGAFGGSVHSREADQDTTFLPPPLPEKKGGREETRGQKGTGPHLPASSSSRPQDGTSCYINNNVDAITTTLTTKNERRLSQGIISSDHNDVYLPMKRSDGQGGPGDSVYTPMCSPEAQQKLSVEAASVAGRTKRDGHGGIDETASSPLLDSQRSGNATSDQNPQSGSLVPIRFTANTRSFKRKVPKRESLDKRAETSIDSSEQNENLEPFSAASSPPPLPPKKSAAARNPNYIHYASLNLDDVVEKLPSPSSPSGPGGGFQTDTLYRQIDPEKTKALCELKKQMDDNRQRNVAKLAPEH